MGAVLLVHLAPGNARQFEVTIQGEAVVDGAHTLYLIADAPDEGHVRRFMEPFAQAGSVEVMPSSRCEVVVGRGSSRSQPRRDRAGCPTEAEEGGAMGRRIEQASRTVGDARGCRAASWVELCVRDENKARRMGAIGDPVANVQAEQESSEFLIRRGSESVMLLNAAGKRRCHDICPLHGLPVIVRRQKQHAGLGQRRAEHHPSDALARFASQDPLLSSKTPERSGPFGLSGHE